ncbi:MAG: 2-oxo acid dehydrogenase subunit E2 [Thermoleophilia bacterium]|nr:2-oxo acid dehydrogenase subunit E2 [Thermoleophilia bacterium]
MAAPVVMPKLGLTMTAGAVAQWNVGEGEHVDLGQVIVEVMTEKITYQVETPAAGVLLKVVVPEGEEVPVGALIGVVGEQGEDISALLAGSAGAVVAAAGGDGAAPTSSAAPAQVAASSAGAGGARVPASPAARKLAEELGMDLAGIQGSGPGGRVTLDDVTRAAESAAMVPTAPQVTSSEVVAALPAEPAGDAGLRPSTEVPYSGMRRAIGERMATSWTVSPMVTHHARADVHELRQLLAQVNEGRASREKISVTAAVVMAAARALREVPRLNASLTGDTIRLWDEINVGVAVALDDGLIVPVVRQADTKTLGEISREVGTLARRARGNKLTPDDVTGGTFTVSSLGSYGSVDWFTPIINQPEAAILGVGRIVDEVLALDGQPAVRPTMGLSLTFDHRVVDGGPVAEWLKTLLDCLEHPLQMLV